MTPQHAGPCITHHLSDLLSPFRLEAMYGAVETGRLVESKYTMLDASFGVFPKRATRRTQI